VLFAAAAAIALYAWAHREQLATPPRTTGRPSAGADAAGDSVLSRAFRDHASRIEVTGHGTVSRVLPDDVEGSRHQRFIVRLPSGQAVLIAHNIDLAGRLPALRVGDAVAFRGEYEWNEKGGVVHWTHRDPGGRHQGGWLAIAGDTVR
jgi:hypothetical protein